ncbi:MAG: hypothetical protein FWB92_02860 [Oscillospiraceae bacterium]|nr:hypothetical protein [Oscillospiraceae bacterium]
MKVKELIADLSALLPDTEVVAYTDDGEIYCFDSTLAVFYVPNRSAVIISTDLIVNEVDIVDRFHASFDDYGQSESWSKGRSLDDIILS